jgi:radical SAM protein with 4Fe4S-binding SPASM domain
MLYSELTKNRVWLKDKIPLATPFGLFIDPSNFCNFKCSFCPRNLPDFHHFAGYYTHMSIDLFRKIIKDIHQFDEKLKVIRLYYLGEPLLNPNFSDMLDMVMTESITERVEITTNASLLTDKISDRILSISQSNSDVMLYMRFSIYSVLQEHNKRITKNPIDVSIIRKNIQTFQEMRDIRQIKNVSTYAKMIDSFNSDENDMFKDCYSGIVDEVQLEEPMNWSGAENTNLLRKEYGKKNKEIERLSHKGSGRDACQYPFTTLSINSDGTVVTCCVDWSRKTIVGNVNSECLYDIWNGNALRRLRCIQLDGKRFLNEACRNCVRLPGFMPGHEADDLSGLTSAELLSRESKML